LVVDDDAAVRAVVADALAPDGHAVDLAQDGVDALYLLKRRTYDVIVSDLRMPMLDGPGLYRALQQRYAAVLPRVIFVTGECGRRALHGVSRPDGGSRADEALYRG
jgi:CheY-like chemotaxis protein